MLLLSVPAWSSPFYLKFLSKETFPSAWKHSIILPLPKISNPSFFTSLRPITLPSFLSRILERIIFTQLNHFLCNNKIIHEFQSGFRKHFSTITSILHLSDAVLRSFNSHSLSALVALDFSKAFDTVNHELLLAKLRYNLSNLAISLFRSFFLNCSQSILIRIFFLRSPHHLQFPLKYLKAQFWNHYFLTYLLPTCHLWQQSLDFICMQTTCLSSNRSQFLKHCMLQNQWIMILY